MQQTRRRFLQTGGAIGGTALASGVPWDGSSVEVVSGRQEEEPTQEITEFPPEPTPRDVHNFETLHAHNKREDVIHLLRHPDVHSIVQDFYYADFEAFDDWIEDHAVGINGSKDFQIENPGRDGLEQGEHRVQTNGTHWIRGLLDKESKELKALDITGPESYEIVREYGEDERRILEAVLEKEPVQDLLEGKDWWVGIGKVTSISTYSTEYKKSEVTYPVFILPRGNEYIVVDTGIEVKNFPDDPQPGELVYAQAISPWDADPEENQYGMKPVGRVREPIKKLASQVSVDDGVASADEMDDVPVTKRPWLFRGPGHFSGEVKAATPNPVEQNGWTIDWRDSSTDGMIFSALYNGTKVFDRAACSLSLTAYPPHGGRYSTDLFAEPRGRVDDPHGNVMFHDNLGLTGPGVLGKQDLPSLDVHSAPDRPPGFKLRTHYHTGATLVQEFHGGARYGPYNYVIDWNFFEDGVLIPTYQRNGPGYETGHDWPVYASMFAFDVTPAGQRQTEVQWFDGNSWTNIEEEGQIIAEGKNEILRVQDPESETSIEFPTSQHDEIYVVRRHEDEIGVAPRVEDGQREKDFWHPVQYADGEPVSGEDVVVWYVQNTHTSEVPYKSGTVPFINHFNVRVTGT